MTSATTVRPLAATEIPEASRVLAQAFRDDPLVVCLLPSVSRRELLLARFYRWFLRYGMRYGEVHVPSNNVEGAAMWLPPEDDHGMLLRAIATGAALLPFAIGPRFFLKCWSYAEHIGQLRSQHAPFPHWFLQLLGVNPECQRRGHATTLLHSMFERLDRERIPCCLDTVKPANLDFYGRLGFRVVAESQMPRTTIRCWLMVRGA